jgi:hypothetical protein
MVHWWYTPVIQICHQQSACSLRKGHLRPIAASLCPATPQHPAFSFLYPSQFKTRLNRNKCRVAEGMKAIRGPETSPALGPGTNCHPHCCLLIRW